MIAAQTPNGKKNFILRGAWTPRGKVNIATVKATTPAGDQTFWDATVAGGFSIAATPSSVRGTGANASPILITTNEAVVSQTGGALPISYVWSQVGASDWSIEAALASRTRFTSPGVDAYTQETATFRCTATDAAGRVATVDVSASAENYGDPRNPVP